MLIVLAHCMTMKGFLLTGFFFFSPEVEVMHFGDTVRDFRNENIGFMFLSLFLFSCRPPLLSAPTLVQNVYTVKSLSGVNIGRW